MPVAARLAVGWIVLSVLVCGSCNSTGQKQAQLERVAKDWCMTIRASQVMPVYPLTQDLQPGDVFLVQLPIDRQQAIWRNKGYLPLDNHLARIDPEHYAEFYSHSFAFDPDQSLPLLHLTSTPAWTAAPHAGFPTYSFTVRSGEGLNLAIPISGVPVGLGLLGADAAEGSVSIGKAHTLGIDLVSIDEQVRRWAAEHRSFLAGFASAGERHNYLRVVTRVYLTGELDVSLRDTSQRSGGLDVGIPSPVAALTPKVSTTTETTPQAALASYEDGIAKLNEMLASEDRYTTDAAGARQLTPGGSLRITSATARTIAMKEIFDPPLVLGYLGFDCQVLPGGELGPPVPTYAVVSGALGGEAFLARTPSSLAYLDSANLAMYEIAKAAAAEDAVAAEIVAQLDALAKLAPPGWDVWSIAPDGALVQSHFTPPADTLGTYELFRQWRRALDSSSKDIEATLQALPKQLRRADGSTVEVAKDSAEAKALESELAALRLTLDAELIEASHAQARRALADWFFARLYEPPTH